MIRPNLGFSVSCFGFWFAVHYGSTDLSSHVWHVLSCSVMICPDLGFSVSCFGFAVHDLSTDYRPLFGLVSYFLVVSSVTFDISHGSQITFGTVIFMINMSQVGHSIQDKYDYQQI